jgi:hypothetical protein
MCIFLLVLNDESIILTTSEKSGLHCRIIRDATKSRRNLLCLIKKGILICVRHLLKLTSADEAGKFEGHGDIVASLSGTVNNKQPGDDIYSFGV